MFWNMHRNSFSFPYFSKWRKYYNLSFHDAFKMNYCLLCYFKFKIHKQNDFKLLAAEYSFYFFLISSLCLFPRDFQTTYAKTIIFKYKFPKFLPRCSTLAKITMSNLPVLKWRLFQYKAIFFFFLKTEKLFCCCFNIFAEYFLKNFHFLIQIWKINFKMYCITEFYDLKSSSTKMTAL